MNAEPMDEGRSNLTLGASDTSLFDPKMLREALAKQIRTGVVSGGPAPRSPMKANTVVNIKDRFRRKKFEEAMANPMGLSPAQMAALTMVPGMGQASADTSQLYRQG